MPARYKDLTMPVGILYGTDDRILDPALHGKGLAAKAGGADLEFIEGGGHMILITLRRSGGCLHCAHGAAGRPGREQTRTG